MRPATGFLLLLAFEPLAIGASQGLTMNLVALPTPVQLGGLLPYGVGIFSPGTSQNVVLTDALPSTVTITRVTTTSGMCTVTGSTVRCAIGNLQAQSAFVDIQVTPNQLGDLQNTAAVTSDNLQ